MQQARARAKSVPLRNNAQRIDHHRKSSMSPPELSLVSAPARDPCTRCSALGVVCFMIASMAAAQPYPAKPLRVIVPSVPGGNLDLVARSMAQQISPGLRQQVVVENRAGSTVGARFVAKAPPDGYTLLMMSNSFATGPSVIANAGYDPVKDYAAVSLVARVPLILVVNPSLPARSVKEFIALAKAHPGELTFGGSGVGSLGHTAGESFAQQAAVKMRHVPYKGNAQALVDLVAGQISFMLDQISSSTPYILAGRLRPLGVSTLTRSPVFPAVVSRHDL
jgi:tripartite-type tricarboxylate transporter receptor subunit TctC